MQENKSGCLFMNTSVVVVHSKRSGMDHTVLHANYTIPVFNS